VLRFRVGAGWKEDPEVRLALTRGRPGPSPVDAVAVEVDGLDLCAGRAEAELPGALEELVLGAARLVAGGHRAAVHFAEGGVELLLRRRGATALLTLVALERPSRVLAADVEVELHALARAAREAGEALADDLAALGPAGHDLARGLHEALARLAAARPVERGETVPAGPAHAARPSRHRPGPSCGFELRDDEGLLASYDGEGADLGSLLAGGRTWLRDGAGEELLALDGPPFLALRDLAALGGRIAAARRVREPWVEAVLAAGRARHRLSLDLRQETIDAGEGARPCPPLPLARALLEAAVDLCGAAVARNPRQGRNPYVVELRREASAGLEDVRELLAGEQVAEGGAPVRGRLRRLPREPLAPGRMRRLAFRRSWQADTGAPAGVGLARAGDLVLACGAAAVLGLDAASGQERWRAAGASWADRAGPLLLALRASAVEAHDPVTGARRWSRALPGPTVRAAASLRDGPVVVAAGASLVGLDLATGRVRWRFEPPAARALHLAGFGALALAAGDAGFLYAVSGAGRLAWRLHLPGPPVGPPQPLGDDGLVLCATDLGGALVRFDAATGRRRFEAPLEFTPTAPAVPFAGLVGVCGSVGGDPVVAAVEPAGAIAWTDAAPLPGPLAAGALGAALVVKTAGGAAAALDRTGRVLWSDAREAPHPPPANLPPVAARGLAIVPGEQVIAHDATSGTSLGAARLGAPVRLLVAPDLALHAMDAEGLVLAARLATHLSVL